MTTIADIRRDPDTLLPVLVQGTIDEASNAAMERGAADALLAWADLGAWPDSTQVAISALVVETSGARSGYWLEVDIPAMPTRRLQVMNAGVVRDTGSVAEQQASHRETVEANRSARLADLDDQRRAEADLAVASRTREQTERDHHYADQEWRRAVHAARAAGLGVTHIARLSMLSRERIYQILSLPAPDRPEWTPQRVDPTTVR